MRLSRWGFALLPLALIACSTGVIEDDVGSNASALKALDPNDPSDPPPPELDPTPPAPPTPPPIIDRFGESVSRFNGYDYDGDGVKEIEALSQLPLSCTRVAAAPKGVVVVMVDPRILAGSSQYAPAFVQIMLDMWCSDMQGEGYAPRFVSMKVRRTLGAADGTTVLAMRRFLQDVRSQHTLSGAILVGDFPEPKLLRSTVVRGEIRDPTMFGGVTVDNVDALYVNAELIALRSDLVLADLDGGWESIYRPSVTVRQVALVPSNVPTSNSSWPQPFSNYFGPLFNMTVDTFKDVFFIRDETATVTPYSGGIQISTGSAAEPGPELSAADRTLTNPIARPEINVTRINARHVGRKPVNAAGVSALDASGVPRSIPDAGGEVRWVDDIDTEVRVLMNFLQRDRGFRQGSDGGFPLRTAVIRSPDERLVDPWTYNGVLKPAHASFSSNASVIVDNASLLDYLNWLEQPAVLRGVISHATATFSSFTDATVPVPSSSATIAKTGPAWRWVRQNGMLVPSFEGVGSGQMEIYRSLFENGKLVGKGQRFYVNNGCEVNSPANGSAVNYVDPRYAELQNAESELFFTNGLAVLSRAKVFFDIPKNVGVSIKNQGNFGGSLQGYFASDAADGTLAPLPFTSTGMARRGRALNRKKTYFWSIIGDYTLRMQY